MDASNPNSHCPVLFVEDSSNFREKVIRKYLAGCRVDVVWEAPVFRDKLGLKTYHFILMDYELPDTSGEILTLEARAAGYPSAIIGVSSSEYLNRKLLMAGADTEASKGRAYLLPRAILQALRLAEARGCAVHCQFPHTGG